MGDLETGRSSLRTSSLCTETGCVRLEEFHILERVATDVYCTSAEHSLFQYTGFATRARFFMSIAARR